MERKTDRSESLQQFVALTLQLLEDAQRVCGLWLERALRSDRGQLRKHLQTVRLVAGEASLAIADEDIDERVRLDVERERQILARFQERFALFHLAMGDSGLQLPWSKLPSAAWLKHLGRGLRLEMAGLIQSTGVDVGGRRCSSACEELERVCAQINLIVDSGQVPDRQAAAAWGSSWVDLSRLVRCEVAALLRMPSDVGSGAGDTSKTVRASEIYYSDGKPVPGQTLDNWCKRGLLLSDAGKVCLQVLKRAAGERVFDRSEVSRFVAHSEQHRRPRGPQS